jgi:hypothetical protein
LDYIFGLLTDSDVLWEAIIVHPDAAVGGFDVVCLEWRLADDESVDDDTQ